MALITIYSRSTAGSCTLLTGTSYAGLTTASSITQALGSASVADLASISTAVPASNAGTITTLLKYAPGVTSWPAGTYAVDITVGSANMNLTLDAVHILKINNTCSSGSASIVGSATGLGVSLGSVGALSRINITGSAASPASTDVLIVALVINSSSMSSQVVGLTFTVATPIDDGAAIAGTLSKSLPMLMPSTAAKVDVVGSVAKSLPMLSISATASGPSINGTVAATLPSLSVASSGSAVPKYNFTSLPFVRTAGVMGAGLGLPLILRNPRDVVGAWDRHGDGPASGIRLSAGDYLMYFEGYNFDTGTGVNKIGVATSTNGYTWTKDPSNPDITPNSANWEQDEIAPDQLLYDPYVGEWKMYYHGGNNAGPRQIGLLTSPTGLPGSWTRANSGNPVLPNGGSGAWDERRVADCFVIVLSATDYRMIYCGERASDNAVQIGYATSTDGITWTKHGSNPVFPLGTGNDSNHVYSPGGFVDETGRVHMWYGGEDASAVERVLYAYSDDWVNWTRNQADVIDAPSAVSTDPDTRIGNVIKSWMDEGIVWFSQMNRNDAGYPDGLGALEGRGLYWLPKKAIDPALPARAYTRIGDYNAVDPAAAVSKSTVFTVWADFKCPPYDDYRHIYAEGSGVFNHYVAIRLTDAGLVQWVFRVPGGTEIYITSPSGTRYDDNAWHRAMVVRKGGDDWELWVDGSLVGTNTDAGTSTNTDTTFIGLGDWNPSSAPGNQEPAIGLLRETMTILDTALTGTEEATWNASRTLPGGVTPTVWVKHGTGGPSGADVAQGSATYGATPTATTLVDLTPPDDLPTGGSGTLDKSLPMLSLAAAAVLAIVGSATPSLPMLSRSATATVAIQGAATRTLPSLSVSASGSVSVTGTASKTLPALSSSASGAIRVAGVATKTLPMLTSTTDVDVAVVAAGTPSIPALTIASGGTVSLQGTASRTLPSLSVSSGGTVVVQGAGAASIPMLTVSASTTTESIGTVALTLPALTGAAGGVVEVRGTSARTLPALAVSAAGIIPINATATIVLPSLTVASAGAIPLVGATSSSIPMLSVSGAAGAALQGSLAATLPSLSSTGAGAADVEGVTAASLPSLSIASAGVVAVQGTSTTTLPMLTINASSGTTTIGAVTLTVPALSASGSGTVPVTGAGTPTIPSLTAAGTGSETIQGAVAASIPSLVPTTATRVLVQGSGSLTLPSLAGTSSGSSASVVAVALTIPALTGASTGQVAITGSASVALPMIVGSSGVSTTINGAVSATLPALTVSAFGLSGALQVSQEDVPISGGVRWSVPITLDASPSVPVKRGDWSVPV